MNLASLPQFSTSLNNVEVADSQVGQSIPLSHEGNDGSTFQQLFKTAQHEEEKHSFLTGNREKTSSDQATSKQAQKDTKTSSKLDSSTSIGAIDTEKTDSSDETVHESAHKETKRSKSKDSKDEQDAQSTDSPTAIPAPLVPSITFTFQTLETEVTNDSLGDGDTEQNASSSTGLEESPQPKNVSSGFITSLVQAFEMSTNSKSSGINGKETSAITSGKEEKSDKDLKNGLTPSKPDSLPQAGLQMESDKKSISIQPEDFPSGSDSQEQTTAPVLKTTVSALISDNTDSVSLPPQAETSQLVLEQQGNTPKKTSVIEKIDDELTSESFPSEKKTVAATLSEKISIQTSSVDSTISENKTQPQMASVPANTTSTPESTSDNSATPSSSQTTILETSVAQKTTKENLPAQSPVSNKTPTTSAGPTTSSTTSQQTVTNNDTMQEKIPSVSSDAISGVGTPTAKTQSNVSQTNEQNKTAMQTEQKLPDAVSSSVPSPNIPKSDEVQNDTKKVELSPTPFVKAAETTSQTSPTAPTDKVTTPHTTHAAMVEKLTSSISNEITILRQIRPDKLDVVLRPDADTQISLQLSYSNGRIEGQARCERGDFVMLNSHWGELQQTFDQQGIRLFPLRDPTSGFNFSGGGYGNSPQSQQERRARELEDLVISNTNRTNSPTQTPVKDSSAQTLPGNTLLQTWA